MPRKNWNKRPRQAKCSASPRSHRLVCFALVCVGSMLPGKHFNAFVKKICCPGPNPGTPAIQTTGVYAPLWASTEPNPAHRSRERHQRTMQPPAPPDPYAHQTLRRGCLEIQIGPRSRTSATSIPAYPNISPSRRIVPSTFSCSSPGHWQRMMRWSTPSRSRYRSMSSFTDTLSPMMKRSRANSSNG
jgi:hypothetical protein